MIRPKTSMIESREKRTVTIDSLDAFPAEEEEQEAECEEESSASGLSYVCPQCQATFGNALHLDDHQVKHAQGLLCPLCGYEGTSKETVIGHEKLHRNRNSLQCLLCKERLVEEKQFMKHLNRHVLNINSCPWCPFMSEGVSALKKHIDYHLAKFRVDCAFCNYFAFSEEDLRVHNDIHAAESRLTKSVPFKRKPAVPQTTSINICQEDSSPGDVDHKTKCKLKLDSLLERALFRCCLCGKKLKSDKQLREHTEKHMNPGVSYCPYCTFQSTDRELIFQHVLDHLQPTSTIHQEEKSPSQDSL